MTSVETAAAPRSSEFSSRSAPEAGPVESEAEEGGEGREFGRSQSVWQRIATALMDGRVCLSLDVNCLRRVLSQF